MPDARVTLRRRNPYSTLSNRVRKVKTPGGKLVVQYIKKSGSSVRCGDTKTKLHGISIGRPKDYMRMSKPKKTVTRVYGGTLCAKAVRERYVSRLPSWVLSRPLWMVILWGVPDCCEVGLSVAAPGHCRLVSWGGLGAEATSDGRWYWARSLSPGC